MDGVIGTRDTAPVISVVVPAHNEASGLPRLLEALTPPANAERLEIVVVANGCTDATAEVARRFDVTVLETPVASKVRALALGDTAATSFPRVYVDGDVVISHRDVVRLAESLTGGVHAAGPRRVLPMTGASVLVRWYYEVWQQLPGVRTELYGRGVVAVDEVGHRRLQGWGEVMSDDLLVAMSFSPAERTVVEDAAAVIQPPKRYRDLVRRRVRAMSGNARLVASPDAPAVRGSGASPRFLAALALRHPRLIPGVVVFVGTAALAQVRARSALRRGDTTWLRDESSRSER